MCLILEFTFSNSRELENRRVFSVYQAQYFPRDRGLILFLFFGLPVCFIAKRCAKTGGLIQKIDKIIVIIYNGKVIKHLTSFLFWGKFPFEIWSRWDNQYVQRKFQT